MGWCPGPARRDLRRLCCSLSVSSHEPVDEHEQSENESNEIAHVLGAAGIDLYSTQTNDEEQRQTRETGVSDSMNQPTHMD